MEIWAARAKAVIKFGGGYMEEVTADGLRPILLFMYSAALIPGSEFNLPCSQKQC